MKHFSEETSFNSQDQSPDDSYDQDRRGAPRMFFDSSRKVSQVFARLHTKQTISVSHLFLQLVSQDSVQELFRHTISPYIGVSRIQFQFCCLHSVDFGVSWTFTVIFLNVSRGSTLFASLYISFP